LEEYRPYTERVFHSNESVGCPLACFPRVKDGTCPQSPSPTSVPMYNPGISESHAHGHCKLASANLINGISETNSRKADRGFNHRCILEAGVIDPQTSGDLIGTVGFTGRGSYASQIDGTYSISANGNLVLDSSARVLHKQGTRRHGGS
jgi:hypothetical protein